MDGFHAMQNMFSQLRAGLEQMGPVTTFPAGNFFEVLVDRPSYLSGELVTGTVRLTLNIPVNCSGVILKVKGLERSRWSVTSQNTQANYNHNINMHHVGGGGQTHTVQHGTERYLFREIVNLFNAPGMIQPGQYSWPFQYQLPPNTPSTMFSSGQHGTYRDPWVAMVLYKFKASINVGFRHNLKMTARVVVNEKEANPVGPSSASNEKSFLMTSGKLSCHAWLDKSAYFPGELVLAKLESNNTSEKPTTKLRVRIHRKLQLSAPGSSLNIEDVVFETTYPGFGPFFYGDRYLPFAIPVNLQPSTNGQVVKHTYYYTLECDIPGAVDLTMSLPFKVVAPQFLFMSHPPQPKFGPPPPDVMFRPTPQEKSQHCSKCNSEFSSLGNPDKRCRHCLKLFCGKCCSSKTPIRNLGFDEAVRVCDACFPIAAEGGLNLQTMANEVNAASNEVPKKSGNLNRMQKIMGMKNWNKKVAEFDGTFLKLYDNEKDRAKNVVDWSCNMRDASLAREETKEEAKEHKRQNLVVLEMKNNELQFFEVGSDKDANEWIAAMNAVIKVASQPRLSKTRTPEEYLAHCRELAWKTTAPLFPPPNANLPPMYPPVGSDQYPAQAGQVSSYPGQSAPSSYPSQGAPGVSSYPGQEQSSYPGQGAPGVSSYPGQGAPGVSSYLGQSAPGVSSYPGQVPPQEVPPVAAYP